MCWFNTSSTAITAKAIHLHNCQHFSLHHPLPSCYCCCCCITNMAFCECVKCSLFPHSMFSFFFCILLPVNEFCILIRSKYEVFSAKQWRLERNKTSCVCLWVPYVFTQVTCASIYVCVLHSGDDAGEKRRILVSTRGTVEKVRARHSKLKPLSLSC